MKNLTLITIILFTACSVFKHKTEKSSSQKDLTVHAAQRKDSLELTAQARRISFQSNDRLELTEIIPRGKFVYRPDSGFRGAARSLRVYRQTRQLSLQQDTSSINVTAGSNRRGVDSTVHEQAQQQLEETKKSKPVPVWIVVLAAAILLLAFNFVWRKG